MYALIVHPLLNSASHKGDKIQNKIKLLERLMMDDQQKKDEYFEYQDLCDEVMRLPEYRKKELAARLIASTLNHDSAVVVAHKIAMFAKRTGLLNRSMGRSISWKRSTDR